MKHKHLLFASLLCVALLAGCSQRAELRQEVAVANALLPADVALGVTANAIEISGDDLIFDVTLDDGYFSDIDFNDPQHIEYMLTLLGMSWSSGDDAFRNKVKRAGCDVVYRATLLNSGRQFEWRVPNDRL